jgi:hypothetical protein
VDGGREPLSPCGRAPMMLPQTPPSVQQTFGQQRRWVLRASRCHTMLFQSLGNALWPFADVLLRLWIAQGFLASGVHQMMAGPAATMLADAVLQSLLTEKLKPFVNEPQVTVIARDIRSRKVFLAGQVNHAGSFPINSRLTVLELLLQAGGLGTFAKSESIYILRTQDGKQARIPFKYKKALSGKAPDVVLQPGDMVVVP